MDSIDFNSYLPEEKESNDVKRTKRYGTYKSMLENARKSCDDVVEKIPKKIREIIPPKKFSDENKRTQYLVYQLFKAKKLRLEAREQTEWKEEKNIYIKATDKLHKAFASMRSEDFCEEVGKNIYTESNWAKVLYYNEIAICHSGLTESSMSSGYAEKTIELLEELHPELKNIENTKKPLTFSQLLKLYTFALYNKGEAERLLHNENLALRTFERIKRIYNKNNNSVRIESSDYYSALLRMALILIDQGRGEETLKILENVNDFETYDYREEEYDMERASAYIDQKKYKEARKTLDGYKGGLTFTSRKASLYIVRCLFEWRKNKPIEFSKKKEFSEEKERELKEKREEYHNIPKEIRRGIIENCIDRKDEDNFKRACRYYSEFHKLEREKIEEKQSKKSSEEEAEELKKKELWGYFLYLFHERMYDDNKGLRDMLDKDLKDLKRELNDVDSVLDKIEDTEYMKDFFDVYRVYPKDNRDDQDRIIIEKLYERLGNLYREKDNLIELGELDEKCSLYEEKIKGRGGSGRKVTKESVKFVKKCFFQREPFDNDKKSIFLGADSILARMEQNTFDFSEKIVGKTKRFPLDETFRGILTVLRRWNSFTPALASSVNPSKGGGYFLYFCHKDSSLGIHKDSSLGIVVDPGYDFLDNLFSQGYRIGDIDAVIVSHAHPDHTDNLPSILSLFHEVNGRLGKYYHKNKFNRDKFNKRHLKLILSQGVFDQYYKLIKPSEESLEDIFVVGKKNTPCYRREFDKNHSLEIVPFATSHRDLSQWESLGFIIKINDNGSLRQIGYTSDAHWKQDFSENFKDCHIICAHLGSIVDILGEKPFCSLCKNYMENRSEKCKKFEKCKEERFGSGEPDRDKLLEQAQEQSHLYLSGLTMFFDKLLSKKKMELAVISEFGEELKDGIRMDLYHKFDDWFRYRSKKTRCLPGDIGLEIDLLNSNILCCCCQEFKSKEEILPIAYGKEEGLFFVCDECKSVLSTYQIEEKLRDYYENGRKLELADESK